MNRDEYFMSLALKEAKKAYDKGEGLTFYGSEEAIIAYNEKKCDLHSQVKVIVDDLVDGKLHCPHHSPFFTVCQN